MKSNIIPINHMGNGFDKAMKETRKVCVYQELDGKNALQLQLCTEEMLSLVRSITGGVEASFWIESENSLFELHLTAKAILDKEKRASLISSSSTRKNEAANSFLGKVRDAFETALAADVDQSSQIPEDVLPDLPNHPIESLEWDGYERSVLKKVSDQVKVGIRGDKVELTVLKKF